MIYHIVAERDFRSCEDGEQYLPSGFATDGFVHCALEASVLPVANDFYGGATGTLLLLRIDPAKLRAPTRYEAASPSPAAGTSHLDSSAVFPHVYGPIDFAAVDAIGILTKGRHGFQWPATFTSLAKYLGRGVA
jgi:uncharacterized protein